MSRNVRGRGRLGLAHDRDPLNTPSFQRTATPGGRRGRNAIASSHVGDVAKECVTKNVVARSDCIWSSKTASLGLDLAVLSKPISSDDDLFISDEPIALHGVQLESSLNIPRKEAALSTLDYSNNILNDAPDAISHNHKTCQSSDSMINSTASESLQAFEENSSFSLMPLVTDVNATVSSNSVPNQQEKSSYLFYSGSCFGFKDTTQSCVSSKTSSLTTAPLNPWFLSNGIKENFNFRHSSYHNISHDFIITGSYHFRSL